MSSPNGRTRVATVLVTVFAAACARNEDTAAPGWEASAAPSAAAMVATSSRPFANGAGDWTLSVAQSGRDTGAATYATGAPTPLIDLVGDWNMRSLATAGDTMALAYVLTATGYTTGWTMTLEDGQRIKLDVAVAADSIVTHAGPFESVRREGVLVGTDATLRLQGEHLVGRTIAHYLRATPDSIVSLTTTGVRAR